MCTPLEGCGLVRCSPDLLVVVQTGWAEKGLILQHAARHAGRLQEGADTREPSLVVAATKARKKQDREFYSHSVDEKEHQGMCPKPVAYWWFLQDHARPLRSR